MILRKIAEDNSVITCSFVKNTDVKTKCDWNRDKTQKFKNSEKKLLRFYYIPETCIWVKKWNEIAWMHSKNDRQQEIIPFAIKIYINKVTEREQNVLELPFTIAKSINLFPTEYWIGIIIEYSKISHTVWWCSYWIEIYNIFILED